MNVRKIPQRNGKEMRKLTKAVTILKKRRSSFWGFNITPEPRRFKGIYERVDNSARKKRTLILKKMKRLGMTSHFSKGYRVKN